MRTAGPVAPAAVPVVVSWSGGKDAAWTLHRLRQDPHWHVVGLITMVTGADSDSARVSVHGLRREILQAQADACGLPVIEARIPAQADNPRYEAAFAGALVEARIRWPLLGDIAFGDLFLADVRNYRETLCNRLGWRPHFPLFGSDTSSLAREMLAGGLRATLCCVDTTQLDAAFCGMRFDTTLLAALPPAVDPCGERGEFHTCVTQAPMMSRSVDLVAAGDGVVDGRFALRDYRLKPDR